MWSREGMTNQHLSLWSRLWLLCSSMDCPPASLSLLCVFMFCLILYLLFFSCIFLFDSKWYEWQMCRWGCSMNVSMHVLSCILSASLMKNYSVLFEIVFKLSGLSESYWYSLLLFWVYFTSDYRELYYSEIATRGKNNVALKWKIIRYEVIKLFLLYLII